MSISGMQSTFLNGLDSMVGLPLQMRKPIAPRIRAQRNEQGITFSSGLDCQDAVLQTLGEAQSIFDVAEEMVEALLASGADVTSPRELEEVILDGAASASFVDYISRLLTVFSGRVVVDAIPHRDGGAAICVWLMSEVTAEQYFQAIDLLGEVCGTDDSERILVLMGSDCDAPI